MAFRRPSRNAPAADTYVDEDLDVDLGDDEIEDDEAPRRPARRSDITRPAGRRSSRESTRPAGRSGAARGWDAVRRAKSTKKDFQENLKIGDDEILIHFLEDEPYAVYRQHWIQEAEGRKSFSCLEEDCPLCERLGDRPSARVLFNVAEMTAGGPVVRTWSMGVRLAEKIETLGSKARTSPIDRLDLYWAVSKSGKGTSTEYNLEPIRAESEADLEDWGVGEPLTAEELEDLRSQAAGPDAVRWDSREDLEELADELS